MGLSGGSITDTSELPMVQSSDERRLAQETLGQIILLFKTAMDKSKEYEQKPCDGQLDSVAASLHEKMRGVVKKRQNATSVLRKARFALHDREQFENLVNKVTALTDDLLRSFPEASNKQGQLCADEVALLGDNLRILADTINKSDETLAKALDKILSTPAATTNTHRNYHNKDSHIFNQGDIQGSTFTMTWGR
ncbi:hypothetical protein F5Y13DRAFT_202454 [Hypoxylon sp. FL1857]|nr:hypothetical protein F5Y13DRAFT_202454 [Hypoxylon sp. FL1857]